MAPTTPGTRTTSSPRVDTPEAPRRGRLSKPTVKVVENRRNLRLNRTTSQITENESPDHIPEPAPLVLTAKLDALTHLVETLTNTVSRQCQDIEQVHAEVREIKDQNTRVHEEVRSLRTALDSHNATHTSRATWASVAGQPGTNRNTEDSQTDRSRLAKQNGDCLRISTRRSDNEGEVNNNGFGRYLSTGEANAHIRSALQKTEATKEVQVAGVGTTKTGYVIRFTDTVSKETAKHSVDWLNELGNDTKLVKPRFGVVVHRMPTEELRWLENKKEAMEKIMKENGMTTKGHHLDDIAWLKNKDKPLGTSASLGMWFDTPEAAEWTIRNGLVCGQRYIGSVEAYQVTKKRCHRCLGYGHLAWSCRETMRCGHCSGEHEQRNCPPGTEARCADCSGPHATRDQSCRAQTTHNAQQ